MGIKDGKFQFDWKNQKDPDEFKTFLESEFKTYTPTVSKQDNPISKITELAKQINEKP